MTCLPNPRHRPAAQPRRRSLRLLALAAGLAVSAAAQALQLSYEPVALGWSAAEVDRVAAGTLAQLVQRAERAHEFGCLHHCRRLARVFRRLETVAREQSSRAQALPWSLVTVRLLDVDAMALAGGTVIVSEAFIDRRRLDDAALAFVIGHEMAHSVLEHERQALSFARLLLPRDVTRSVADVYAEMDFNFALVRSMEPVLQQGEQEADELGLLLASRAGFQPVRQLSFLEHECAETPPVTTALVETHPPACARLLRLRERLPLAERIWQQRREGGAALR